MSPGGAGTRSGKVWERVIRRVLEAHYSERFEAQHPVGTKLAGGDYVADFIIWDPSGAVVVSAKWQQTPGTTEEKVLYDIACLSAIVHATPGYRKAYVILGGGGFSPKMRQFLLQQGHRDVLQHGELVEVISLEDFLAKANKGQL